MERIIEFKMERENLVQVGEEVLIRESLLPNTVYYYVIERSVAMSGNFKSYERLKRADYQAPITGIVKDIKQTERGYYVLVSFNEPD